MRVPVSKTSTSTAQPNSAEIIHFRAMRVSPERDNECVQPRRTHADVPEVLEAQSEAARRDTISRKSFTRVKICGAQTFRRMQLGRSGISLPSCTQVWEDTHIS